MSETSPFAPYCNPNFTFLATHLKLFALKLFKFK